MVGGGARVSIDRKDRLVGGSRARLSGSRAPLICMTTSCECEYGTRYDGYGGSCEQNAPWNDAELLVSATCDYRPHSFSLFVGDVPYLYDEERPWLAVIIFI